MFLRMGSSPPKEWSNLDLTMPQMRTMVLLAQGSRRMSELAEALNIGLSSATSMIDRLVNKGLVERIPDSHDRRLVLCQLTRHGRDEMERVWRIERQRITALAHALTEEELETVLHAMKILAAALERQPESAYSDPLKKERQYGRACH
jgi:DNA-binding MarR family transcriptional regulator